MLYICMTYYDTTMPEPLSDTTYRNITLEVCVHTVIVDHESFNGFSDLFLKEDFVNIITMCTQTKSITLLFLDIDFRDVAGVYYQSVN